MPPRHLVWYQYVILDRARTPKIANTCCGSANTGRYYRPTVSRHTPDAADRLIGLTLGLSQYYSIAPTLRLYSPHESTRWLHNNNLTALPDGVFGGLESLTEL